MKTSKRALKKRCIEALHEHLFCEIWSPFIPNAIEKKQAFEKLRSEYEGQFGRLFKKGLPIDRLDASQTP